MAFGDELQSLFDPKCKNTIDLEAPVAFEGKSAVAYRYQAPANGCFGYWVSGRLFSKKINPPPRGRFLVDRASGGLVRYEMEAFDFPKNLPHDTWKVSSTWAQVRIGDETYWLPVTYEIEIGSSAEDLFRAVVEYRNHRHFEASAQVSFKPE